MQETQETWFQFLGQEDPLEKEMATHSSILAWEIPWTEGARQATVYGIAKSRTDQLSVCTHTHMHTYAPLIRVKTLSD